MNYNNIFYIIQINKHTLIIITANRYQLISRNVIVSQRFCQYLLHTAIIIIVFVIIANKAQARGGGRNNIKGNRHSWIIVTSHYQLLFSYSVSLHNESHIKLLRSKTRNKYLGTMNSKRYW